MSSTQCGWIPFVIQSLAPYAIMCHETAKNHEPFRCGLAVHFVRRDFLVGVCGMWQRRSCSGVSLGRHRTPRSFARIRADRRDDGLCHRSYLGLSAAGFVTEVVLTMIVPIDSGVADHNDHRHSDEQRLCDPVDAEGDGGADFSGQDLAVWSRRSRWSGRNARPRRPRRVAEDEKVGQRSSLTGR